MENKFKIIALIGESGAGKDTVLHETLTRHPDICHAIVSCTTRAPRDYETPGVDYHYLTLEEFTIKVLNGDMLEAVEFNNWFYGTAIDALRADKINIGVFNPAGVEALLQDPRLEVDVVRVMCDDKTRLQRALDREEVPDCSEICRRFMADQKDFSALNFDYWIVENYKYTRLECLDLFYESNTLSDILQAP